MFLKTMASQQLLLFLALVLNGALSQPPVANEKALLSEFSQYADRWTLKRTGCTCQYDFTRQDCACCIVGGAQCPIGFQDICVRCGQEFACGIPHPVIKDRVVNGWTGAMECPCPGGSGNDTCACCINSGCPCANDPYRCTQCGTSDGCKDGKNNPAGEPYVLNREIGRSRDGYGIHVHRDPVLPNAVPLGVSSGRIPDNQLTASSYVDDHMGPHRARLNMLPSDAGAGGWSPMKLNRDQFLQIDLVYPTHVTGVATQGRAGNSDEWVTSYHVSHSTDGSNWNFYGGDKQGSRDGKGMMFRGNSDCDEIVHHNLENPVHTRYMRFHPKDYYNRIGMRVELYGQQPEVPTSDRGRIQNLALYKPAQQSSSFEPIFGPAGAVDGRDDEGISITKVQTQPWWYVDLKDHYQIYFVAINNPGIALCAEPKILTNFVVRVGDNPDVNSNPPCSAIYRRKVEPGSLVQIQCHSMDGIPPVGRYVSIELNPDNSQELTHLQVSEVKVYGVATPLPGATCQLKEGVHYLGMQSGEIDGAQISSSSYMKGYQPQNGRLNLPNRAWVAECRPHTPSLSNEKRYYLKIDLLALTDLEGLLTQGSMMPQESYVSQFIVETSVDGETFVPYKAADGTVKLFQSNMDGSDIVCHLFPSQICIRAIKIIPVSWHQCVAMRVEILGFRVQHVEPLSDEEDLPPVRPTVNEMTTGETADEPEPSGDKPEPSGDEPKPSGDKPKPSGDKPEPSGDKPEPSGDKPEPSGDKPEPSGDKPEPSGDKPGPSGDKPGPSGDKPEPSGDKPEPSGDKPEPSGDKPEPSGDKPGPSGDKPGPSGDKPGPSGDKPGPSGDKPGPSGDKPAPSGDKPGPSGDKPGPSGDKPGPSGDKPGPSGDKPGPSGDKPGPSGDKPGPSGDKPGPSGDKPGPSGDKPGPSGDKPEPSGDNPEPLDDVIKTVNVSSSKPGYNPAGGDDAWVAASDDNDQFLDMTFDDPVKISDVTIAPVLTDDGEAMVTDLEVQYQPEGSDEFKPVVLPNGKTVFTMDIAQPTPDGKLIFKMPFTFRTKCLRLLPRKWIGHIGMKIRVQGRKVKSRTFTLKKFVRKYTSSSYAPGYDPRTSDGSWVAAKNDDQQFFQVSFDSPKEVKKIRMTPIKLEKGKIAMVMRFKVLYRNAKQKTFKLYKFPNGKKVFNMKNARNSKGRYTFKLRKPITAKDLRIVPLNWRDQIGFKLNLIGKKTKRKPQKDQGRTFSLKKFVRKYTSSSYAPGYDPRTSDGSWVAAKNDDQQFFQVSFDSPKEVKKIRMTPIKLEKGKIAMVMRFKVLYRNAKQKTFKLYKFPNGKKVFNMKNARNSKGRYTFKLRKPITAKDLRIVPLNWRDQIGFKLNLIGKKTKRKPQKDQGRTFSLKKFVRKCTSSSYAPGYDPRTSDGSWVAAKNDDQQFFQVSFDSPKEVKKIRMTPIKLEKGKIAMVMRFKVLYRNAKQKTFKLYKFPNGKNVFNMKNARNSKGRYTFKLRKPITAKDLRIVPLNWRDQIGFKLNLIGKKTKRKPQKDQGNPMSIPRRLGSRYLTFRPYNPATSGRNLWIPDSKDQSPFLMVTFDQQVVLTSLQARGAKVKGRGEGWVKEFRLRIKENTKDKTWGSYRLASGTDVLAFDPVVKNSKQKTRFNFPEDITVSQLKFMPTSWQNFAAIRLQLWGYYKQKRRQPQIKRRSTLYYLLWMTGASWEEAQNYCSKGNGHLVTITNDKIQDIIEKSIAGSKYEADWWVGITDKDEEGTWVYSDSTSLDYVNWIGGQKPVKDKTKNCAFLQRSEDYLWTDANCAAKKSFICQYDKKPKRDQIDKPIKDFKIRPVYNLYTSRLTWRQALDTCKAAKGSLVRIHNKEKQAIIEKLFQKNRKVKGQFWIDASYRITHKTDNWAYSNGAMLDYNNGLPDEPGKKRRCVHLGTKTDPKFQWTAGKCSRRRGFICEIYPDNKKNTPGKPASDESSQRVNLNVKTSVQIWKGAKRSCEEWGAHLVRIPDAGFEANVVDALNSVKPGSDDTFWIDAHLDKKTMRYIYSNHQPVKYSNFAKQYPKGGCAYLTKSGKEWKWEDGDCNAKRRSICAKTSGMTKPSKPVKPSQDDTLVPLPATYRHFFFGYLYTWQEAAKVCGSVGDGSGHLLRITDQKMFGHVVRIIKQALGERPPANFWIDATDVMSESEFVDSDGEALSYTNWFEAKGAEKQPDGKKKENCVYMSYTDDYMWHDGSCNDRISFICDFPSKPVGLKAPRIPAGVVIKKPKPEILVKPTTPPIQDINTLVTYKASSSDPDNLPNSANGWIAAIANLNQYIIFDFQRLVRLDKFFLRGVSKPGFMAWIKKFQLFYKRTSDDEWRPYVKFDRTSDFVNVVKNPDERAAFLLAPSIVGSMIKFKPLEWNNAIAGRFSFQGQTTAAPMDLKDKIRYKSSPVFRKFKPNGRYGWIPRRANKKQYLIVDFRKTVELRNIQVQKVIVGKSGGWIKAMKLQYSKDGKTWLPYDLVPAEKNDVIQVPYADDKSTSAKLELSIPIVARYVKIIPIEWHTVIAGRFNFYGYRYKGLKFRVLTSRKPIIASDEGLPPKTPGTEMGLSYNLDKFISSVDSIDQTMIVTFKRKVQIWRLKVKGIKQGDQTASVKKFKVLYKNKKKQAWKVYLLKGKKDVFKAPKDANYEDFVTYDLPRPVFVKYVKFQAVARDGAFRVKLLFYGRKKLGKKGRSRKRRSLKMYYSFHRYQASWPKAKQACRDNGGSLVRIFDSRVQEAVVDRIKTSKIQGDWWIDASDADSEGQWVSSVGRLQYVDWLKGDKLPSDDDKDCGYLVYGENYHWAQANCKETKHYICQYESRPKKTPERAQIIKIRLFTYRFYRRRLPWAEAHTACTQRGATLLGMQDPVVQNYLQKHIKNKSNGRTWLDVTYNVAFLDTNAWLYSSGSPMVYNNGLPMNVKGQSCAVVRRKDASWIAAKCDEKYHYICQRQPSPTEDLPLPQSDDVPEEITSSKQVTYHIKRTDDGYTWREAKQYCRSKGAHLLRVQNQEQQNRIIEFLNTNKIKDKFWLDGQRRQGVKFAVANTKARRIRGCVYFSNEDEWSLKMTRCSEKKNVICQKDDKQPFPVRDGIDNPQPKPVRVYYRIYYGKKHATTWAKANEYCNKMGRGSGHLARIYDRDTMDHIIARLSRGKSRKNFAGNFWFDARDVMKEGQFTYSNGDSLSYTNWFRVGKRQEPSGGKFENCAFISTEHGYKWHDGPCDLVLDGFICQFSKKPKATPAHRDPKRDIKRQTAIRLDLSFPKGKFTWQSGARHCRRKYPANGGGHLMRFQNQKQETAIVSALFEKKNFGKYYLDAKLQSDGTWANAKGKAVSYTNWPDGEAPQKQNSKCAVITLKKDGSYSWEANGCKKALPLICMHYMTGQKDYDQGKRVHKDKSKSSSKKRKNKKSSRKRKLRDQEKKKIRKSQNRKTKKSKKRKSKPVSRDQSSSRTKSKKVRKSKSKKIKKSKKRKSKPVSRDQSSSRTKSKKVRKSKSKKTKKSKKRKSKTVSRDQSSSRSKSKKVRKSKGKKTRKSKKRKSKTVSRDQSSSRSKSKKVRKSKSKKTKKSKKRKSKTVSRDQSSSRSKSKKVRKSKGKKTRKSKKRKSKKVPRDQSSSRSKSKKVRKSKGKKTNKSKKRKSKTVSRDQSSSRSKSKKVRKSKGKKTRKSKKRKSKTVSRDQSSSRSKSKNVRKSKGKKIRKSKKRKSKTVSRDQSSSRSKSKKVRKSKSKKTNKSKKRKSKTVSRDQSSSRSKSKKVRKSKGKKTRKSKKRKSKTVSRDQSSSRSKSKKVRKSKSKKSKKRKSKTVSRDQSSSRSKSKNVRKSKGKKTKKSKKRKSKTVSGDQSSSRSKSKNVRKSKGKNTRTSKKRKSKTVSRDQSSSRSKSKKVRKSKSKKSKKRKSKTVSRDQSSSRSKSKKVRKSKGKNTGKSKKRKSKTVSRDQSSSRSKSKNVRKSKSKKTNKSKTRKSKTVSRDQSSSRSKSKKVRKSKGKKTNKSKKRKSKTVSRDQSSSRSKSKKVRKSKSKKTKKSKKRKSKTVSRDQSSSRSKSKKVRKSKGKKTRKSKKRKSKTVSRDQSSSRSKSKKVRKSKSKNTKKSKKRKSKSVSRDQGSKVTKNNGEEKKSTTKVASDEHSSSSSSESGSSNQDQSSDEGPTSEESYSTIEETIEQEVSLMFQSLDGPYADAVAACKAEQMALAVVSESMIQNWIAESFEEDQGDIWIGRLSKDEKTWYDGTPVTQTWWADDKGQGDCLIMSQKDNYRWKHAACTANVGFVACLSKGEETVVN